MNPSTWDVVIVGAGIVGSAIAEALARTDHTVLILDRDRGLTGATGRGMGHLVALDGPPGQLELCRLSLELWRRKKWGETVQWNPTGTLWVAENDQDLAAARAKQSALAEGGVVSNLVTTAELRRIEPLLAENLAGGLLVPNDAVVYPPAAARQLLEDAEHHGARLDLDATVSRVGDGEVRLARGETIHSRHIVIAAGWESSGLLAKLSPDVRVVPKKGELGITWRSPFSVNHQLVELGYMRSAHASAGDSVAFNAQPRPGGQTLVGSSRSLSDSTRRVDPERVSRMMKRAVRFLPFLAQLPWVRCWSGFRPATADHLPLIGPHPHDPTLLLATGHEGLGITQSLGTARLICDHIIGRDLVMDWTPFLPGRASGGSSHD